MSSLSSKGKDIHSFRMQKKIAQLTNVIFELHTLHDEHNQEIEELNNIHEAEVAQIVASYQSSINTLKKQLKQQDTEQLLQKQVVKFQNDFQAYKLEVTKKEELMKEAFQKKLADVIEEMEQKKDLFQDRIIEFSSKIKSLQDMHLKDQQLQKKQHEAELQNLVQTTNKRYNEMYARLIGECEVYKEKVQNSVSELERVKAKYKDDYQAYEALNINYQATCEKLQANINLYETLKASELLLNQRLQQQLNQLNQKDDAIDSLSVSNSELTISLREKEETIHKLHSQNESYQKREEELQIQIQDLIMDKSELQEIVKEKEVSLQLLEVNSRDKDTKIKELTHKLIDLESSIKANSGDYNESLSKLNENISNLEVRNGLLQHKCNEYELECKNVKEAMEKCKLELKNHQAELEESRTLSHKDQETIQILDSKVQELEKLLEKRSLEFSKVSQANLAELNQKLEQTQKKLDELILEKEESMKVFEEYKRDKEAYLNAINISNAEKVKDFQIIISEKNDLILQLQQNIDSQVQISSQGKSDLMKQIESLKEEKANLIREMRDESLRMKKEYEEKIQSIQDKLLSAERQNQGLQDQIQNIRTQWDQEKQLRLEMENRNITLTQENHYLQKEMIDEREKFKLLVQKKLDSQKQALSEQYEKDVALALQNQEIKLLKEKDDEIRTLLDNNVEENNKIHQQTQEKIYSFELQLVDYEDKLKSRESDISALKEEIKRQSEDCESKLAEQVAICSKRLEDIQKSSEKRLENVIQEIIAKKGQEIIELKKNFDTNIEELKTTHFEECSKLKAQHELHIQSLITKYRQEQVEELDRLEKELCRKRDEIISNLKSEHADTIKQLNIEAEESKNDLMSHLKHWNGLAEERLREIEALSTNLKQTSDKNNDLQNEIKIYIDTLVKLRQKHAEELKEQNESLKREANTKLREKIDEHKQELLNFEEILREKEEKWYNEQQDLMDQIRVWEQRFANRESRAEDVERIQILEKVLIEKEAVLRKAIQDIKFFKLELMNREENYNKTFGRTNPSVGLINPLAAKTNVTSGMKSSNVPRMLQGNISQASNYNLQATDASQSPNIHQFKLQNNLSQKHQINPNRVPKNTQLLKYDESMREVEKMPSIGGSRYTETIPPPGSDRIFVKTNQTEAKLPPINIKRNQSQPTNVF